MESRPPDITDDMLRHAVLDGWGITVGDVEYVPKGFGSHHWAVNSTRGERWFVTVDDLDGVAGTRPAAFGVLCCAFGTARILQSSGLDFVVGPVTSAGGAPVRRLGERYTIALFPYVEGRAGDFADDMDASDRAALVDVLAALHTTALPPGAPACSLGFDPIRRSQQQIRDALEQAHDPWTAGPYGEPVRHWLLDHEADAGALIERAARRMTGLAATAEDLVVTHGEPHPGNLVWTDAGLRLIDWDTVGLAPAERDLWFLSRDESALARYSQRTGRAVDGEAIALYRNAWTLSDLAAHLHVFRTPHDETRDTSHAWRQLSNLAWGD